LPNRGWEKNSEKRKKDGDGRLEVFGEEDEEKKMADSLVAGTEKRQA